MDIREIIFNLCSDGKDPSSKRVAGILGWIMCLVIVAYSVITKTQAPNITEILFYTSAGLLGLDTLTRPFNRNGGGGYGGGGYGGDGNIIINGGGNNRPPMPPVKKPDIEIKSDTSNTIDP